MNFGTELRRLRTAAGMSLTDLSKAIHYSRSHLSKVETGAKKPSPDLARLCDTALDCGGVLVRLGPVEPALAAVPHIESKAVWLLCMDDAGRSRFVTAGAAEVEATGLFSGAAAAARSAPTFMVEDAAVSPLASYRAIFTQMRQLGQHAGPETLLPMLIAATHTLHALGTRSSGADRTETLLLAAHFAEYTGWMAQESDNIGYAAWWTDRAVGYASAAGDAGMASYALVRRALVSMYQHDAKETVALAQQAKRASCRPRIRGLAAQREAQGHALAGNRDACMAALDEARRLLASDPGDGDQGRPVLGSTYVPDPVAVATGWALFDLGDPRAAAAVLRTEYDRIPRHALRSRARFGARFALALACSSQVDEACVVGDLVVDEFVQVRSATIRSDVSMLARTLRRWQRHAPADRLGRRLTDALHLPR